MDDLSQEQYGTVYNGSAFCSMCGQGVTPVVAMYSQGPVLCPDCKDIKARRHVQNGMVG